MSNEADALTNKILGEPEMTEQQPTAPTLALEVAGILPFDHDTSDNKLGLLLMADGTVRWTQLQEAAEE